MTKEGLANLEVETDKTGDVAGLWLGQADVKDAFHRLGMPSFFSRYFGYPGCTAEEMKMVGETADGVKLQAGEVLYPLARSLQVGFAWSLWICQLIGDSLCQRTGLLSGSVPLRDRGPTSIDGKGQYQNMVGK